LKLSESIEKITLPGIKQVVRVLDKNEMFYGADAIMLADEKQQSRMYHPFDAEKFLDLKNLKQQPLLQKVMSGGKILIQNQSLNELAGHVQKRLALLPAEYKRFENPHIYKVGISKKLMKLRDDLRHEYKKATE
jgi:nicotinate phosphoribosyltransferase